MEDRPPSDSSLEGTLDKDMSIGGLSPSLSANNPRSRQDEPTSKSSAPLVDHPTAGAPLTVRGQNDELASILSVVERLETVKPSAIGLSETKDADVLSGRGGGTNLHPGNRYFRQLIVSHSSSYDKATKSKKPLVARDVVQQIRRRGGRFLRKDSTDGLFYEIGDDLAREKASQAFRHRTFELRKQKEGSHNEAAEPDATRQIQPPKRMRTTSPDQHLAANAKGNDGSKRQKKDVLVAVAYPARKTHGGIHDIGHMDKDGMRESSSARDTNESLKKRGAQGTTGTRSRPILKEEKEGLTMTTAPEPPPPPWPVADTFPSFVYQSSTGPVSHLLSGISSHPSLRTMLPRRETSASGSFLGGSRNDWDPRFSSAMATRASATSSVSRPNFVGRSHELAQPRDDGRRISWDSLTTFPTSSEDRVPTVNHPFLNSQKSAIDDGTNRALQSSLTTTSFRHQEDSSAALGLLSAPSHDTRFLPQGFQSPWSLLGRLSSQQLALQHPSLVATSLSSSTPTSADVDEYERSLLAAEYILLRRIQQERATLLGRLAQPPPPQQQHEQKEQEQSKGPQNYPSHQGYG